MSKTTRRARIGGRERADACLQLSLPFKDHAMPGDRKPYVYRRGDVRQYQMLFTVAGRRYFGTTDTTDRDEAQAFARSAHAAAVAAREERRLMASEAYRQLTPGPLQSD